MSEGRVLAAVTAVSVVVALATGSQVVLRVSYVLIGVLMLTGILAWNAVRSVDLSRTTRSRRAQVGGVAEETFAVGNRGWLPKLWLEVADDSDLPGHRASRVVSAMGPGERRTWGVRTLCRQRGAFTLGPVTLAGGDPLGMFRREVVLAKTATFVVYPMTVPLTGLQLASGYLSGGPVVRRRAEYATANVRGVRQYQPGDAYKRIHWPTTARRGKLYVKEFEFDPLADIWIVVDLDRNAHRGEAPPDPSLDSDGPLPWMDTPPLELTPTTEEYSVAAAASLARHFLDEGKSVGLVAHGQRRVVLRPDRGERQVNKILGHLAVLRARGRAGLAEVLASDGRELPRHATLAVVTPTTTLRWIDALRELKARGVGSFVILVEASTFGGAAGSSLGPIAALAASGIPTRIVKCNDDLAAALVG